MWTKDKGGETLIISRLTVDVSGGQRDDGKGSASWCAVRQRNRERGLMMCLQADKQPCCARFLVVIMYQ